MADLPEIDDHPIIASLADTAGTFDGDTVAFKRAVIHEIERLRGLLREATMLLFDWDTLNFGRAGDTVRETKDFLKRLGYDGTKPFDCNAVQPPACQHKWVNASDFEEGPNEMCLLCDAVRPADNSPNKEE